MNMKLDHIGVVVNNIDLARDYYRETFGCKPLSGIIYEPAHKVNVLFLDCGYGPAPMIELISPVDDHSRVSNFLRKSGGGLHHLSYAVPDIDKAISHFKGLKAMILGGIVPGAGHGNTRTVWLYTSAKELVELIEMKNE